MLNIIITERLQNNVIIYNYSSKMLYSQSFTLLPNFHNLGATAVQCGRLWSVCHEICRDAHYGKSNYMTSYSNYM